jgi:hypothetical protein
MDKWEFVARIISDTSRITIENEYITPAIVCCSGCSWVDSFMKYSGAVRRAEGIIIVFLDNFPDRLVRP